MSKITRAAKLRSCALRLSGCTNARETVVFAHAPSNGKGMGYKSPDFWGTFACHHCHDILDGRASGMIHDRDLLRAIYETQETLFNEGILKYG